MSASRLVHIGGFTVPANHPCLAGHFPGRNVVPGVVLLDEAMAVILPENARPMAYPAVKFLGVVLPGERVEIACSQTSERGIDFSGTRAGVEILRGRVVAGEISVPKKS